MRVVVWLKKIFTLAWLALFSSSVYAEQIRYFNMGEGVTPISKDIYWLHMTIFWICVVIAILVFSVLIYALAKHRKSLHHAPAQFHGSTKIEILWMVIPFLILVVMAIPATWVLIRMDDTRKADINIKVTGYQWKWKYDYLDQGIGYFSNLSTPRAQIEGREKKEKWYLLEVDKPLIVPIHKKIRFLVTSNDTIHSWWVPALGIKRDAIPGFIYEAWARIDKPGIYRGQCAELCGVNHSYMPIVVVAKTDEDFKKWVLVQTGAVVKSSGPPKDMTKEALMALGETVYGTNCALCHKAGGEGMPPTFAALKGGKTATGPVSEHLNIVLHGRKGTVMQPFGNQLTDEQIAAVITYERNSWGNDDKNKYGSAAGGVIQPAEVAKAR